MTSLLPSIPKNSPLLLTRQDRKPIKRQRYITHAHQQKYQQEGRLATAGLLIAVLITTPYCSTASTQDDDTHNPYIQALVKKSESKREERRKERLQDYYRRNFTDYFAFETSPGMSKQGLSQETSNQMKQWLKENQETSH